MKDDNGNPLSTDDIIQAVLFVSYAEKLRTRNRNNSVRVLILAVVLGGCLLVFALKWGLL